MQLIESTSHEIEFGSNTGPLKWPLLNNSSTDIIEMMEDTKISGIKELSFILLVVYC